jgi:hypothetical protein
MQTRTQWRSFGWLFVANVHSSPGGLSTFKAAHMDCKNSRPMGIRIGMRGLALDYLSKMKIAVMVRQLGLGHILWCGRVVRVERAHRARVVRGVQKKPDVRNGVIGFDHVLRLHVRDFVMAFLEDELVRCCVTHHRAKNFGIVEMRMSQVS